MEHAYIMSYAQSRALLLILAIIFFFSGRKMGITGLLSRFIGKIVAISIAAATSMMVSKAVIMNLCRPLIYKNVEAKIASSGNYATDFMSKIPDKLASFSGMITGNEVQMHAADYVTDYVVAPVAIYIVRIILFFVIYMLIRNFICRAFSGTGFLNNIFLVGTLNGILGGIVFSVAMTNIVYFVLRMLDKIPPINLPFLI